MPAPLGNSFAIGNSGREKTFNTPEELEKYINEYFDKIDSNPILTKDWVGRDADEVYREMQRPYTVEGLCLHLNIDRKTLLNYQKADGYEEFFHIITRAKRRITEQMVTFSLAGGYNAGLAKFLLTNNTEYKDKSEVAQSGSLTLVNSQPMTHEEIKAINQALENEC